MHKESASALSFKSFSEFFLRGFPVKYLFLAGCESAFGFSHFYLLRLKKVELRRGGTRPVGNGRGKIKIIGDERAVVNGVGLNWRPLGEGQRQIRARQQREFPRELAGGEQLDICFG